MLQGMMTRVLQHLIAQNQWAQDLLQPYAGQSVTLDFIVANTGLVILEDGNLAVAGETHKPDVTITIPPGVLMRLLAKDEAAKLLVEVKGDTHLATVLSKVFSHMRWDYEDDLSRLVGDVPATKLGGLFRNRVSTLKNTATSVADMVTEFWQEEKPLIAKKRHVEEFNRDVDTLRADVDRFEKRLSRLQTQLKQTAHNPEQQ